MIDLAKGAWCEIEDMAFIWYASYLIAQNGDAFTLVLIMKQSMVACLHATEYKKFTSQMLNSEQNPERSVATKADSSTTDGYIIF